MDVTLLVLVIILTVAMVTNGQFPDYGIVVDAGSSGSRARVYQISLQGKQVQVPSMKEVYSYKVRPGISAFGGRTADLDQYIKKLMDNVKNSNAIPELKVTHTPIYFMATAGGCFLIN